VAVPVPTHCQWLARTVPVTRSATGTASASGTAGGEPAGVHGRSLTGTGSLRLSQPGPGPLAVTPAMTVTGVTRAVPAAA